LCKINKFGTRKKIKEKKQAVCQNKQINKCRLSSCSQRTTIKPTFDSRYERKGDAFKGEILEKPFLLMEAESGQCPNGAFVCLALFLLQLFAKSTIC